MWALLSNQVLELALSQKRKKEKMSSHRSPNMRTNDNKTK